MTLSSAMAIAIMCAGLVYGNNSSCLTPNGKRGECTSLAQCKPLLNLLEKPNKTDLEITLLTKSHCGSMLGGHKVCCPKQIESGPVGGSATCSTPDGKPGKCISIYSCQEISNKFRPPISEENIAFLKKSKCNGPAKYSVCCGLQPVKDCPASMTALPPDPGSKCCGEWAGVSDKIVGMGGNGTAIDQYPWMVIIEYNTEGGQTVLYCGGVLISGKYVLTAAHCIASYILTIATPTTVRLGEYDISNEGEDCVEAPGGGEDCTDGVTRIAIEKTIPHPDYDHEKSRRNDIGLIRLKKIAPWTDFIRPVCLPAKDLTLPKHTPPNFSMYAVGWGATELALLSNVKVHVNLPFVSLEKCQNYYSGKKVALWKGQLCAGGNKGEDSCKGDSGGPLVYENQDRLYELIGIISFGSVPCGQKIPGVYTNVYEYLDWIQRVIVE